MTTIKLKDLAKKYDKNNKVTWKYLQDNYGFSVDDDVEAKVCVGNKLATREGYVGFHVSKPNDHSIMWFTKTSSCHVVLFSKEDSSPLNGNFKFEMKEGTKNKLVTRTEDSIRLGERLKKHRTDAGLTFKQLSALTNGTIGFPKIGRIENGSLVYADLEKDVDYLMSVITESKKPEPVETIKELPKEPDIQSTPNTLNKLTEIEPGQKILFKGCMRLVEEVNHRHSLRFITLRGVGVISVLEFLDEIKNSVSIPYEPVETVTLSTTGKTYKVTLCNGVPVLKEIKGA